MYSIILVTRELEWMTIGARGCESVWVRRWQTPEYGG